MTKKQWPKSAIFAMPGLIAVFVIAAFIGFGFPAIEGQTLPTQPAKMVFVEEVSTTAVFTFREGEEIVPIQQFTQTGGFAIRSLAAPDDARASSGKNGKSIPSFTMEKVLGGTPYLYAAADQTQKYYVNSAYEYPYKFFDVTVILSKGSNILRSFDYRDCQITNYAVTTRSDNEEGYAGKGFALVDQFSFECQGYTPQNPAMEQIHPSEKAKTISSLDLRTTDQWSQGFKSP